MKKVFLSIAVFLVFILIYILQSNFFTWFNIAGVKPNLVIILVLFIGLFAGRIYGLTFGVIFGLLIDIFISYKTNCLIKYGLLIYNKDNKFIKDVFATYFKTYIDNYYYDIFHTVDVLEFNEEVLKKEFIGCMEELLDEYRNYELQVSNEEYSNNVKIIKELKDISYEITKMDLLNYKDRDDVVDVVSKFIKENSLLNNLIGERLIKLISLVKEYYTNTSKIFNYQDEFFYIENRKFKNSNYSYLGLNYNIKLLNNYRKGLVRREYSHDDYDFSKFNLIMKKISIDIIKNIKNRDKLYFVELSDDFIYRGKIKNKVYELMDNPLIRKHVVFLVNYNLYLNQKEAFSFDYLFGCIQDFTYIQDIYKKTDNIYNEGMFNYLVVSGCKEKDKKFFMEYENEGISVLMFEEE